MRKFTDTRKSSVIAISFLVFCCSVLAQTETKQACPSILVTGPAGIVNPGGIAIFTGDVSGNIPPNVVYVWSVSDGEIVSGQNTPSLRVRFPAKYFVSNLTATLQIRGLPDRCPNMGSESYLAAHDNFDPILVDEYRNIPAKREFLKLNAVVRKLKEKPNDLFVLVMYFPYTNQKFRTRPARVKQYLTRSLKLHTNEFKILTAIGDRELTKIYFVPPGTSMPQP